MPRPATPPPVPPPPERDLSRTYALVIVVEAVTIAALYWFSRAFS
jgi:hypothetical protein